MADYSEAKKLFEADEWQERKNAAPVVLARINKVRVGVNHLKRAELDMSLEFEDGTGVRFTVPWVDLGYLLERHSVFNSCDLEGKWAKFKADQTQVYSMEALLW